MFRRIRIFIFSAVILTTLTAAGFSALLPTDHHYTITKITDGDSLRADKVRIRLHGLDAPEMRQICQDNKQQDYQCGVLARDYLADVLGSDASVRCDHIDTDKYNRLVMRCFHNGVDIASGMVRAGWAVAYRRYSTDYVQDEAEARKAKRGLWAGRFEMPEAWRRNN
ncbi:MAG: thermonuclease family protein [Candidatus Puniceispirillaceae bacterium]